jgi:hypothetical protein
MGRGRAKAKQTKVARRLKYNAPQTDLDALRQELSGGSGGSSQDEVEEDDFDEYGDYADYDKYADYAEDDVVDDDSEGRARPR